ncbi:hypothetical protein GN956_G4444 [Arapaima gigas]
MPQVLHLVSQQSRQMADKSTPARISQRVQRYHGASWETLSNTSSVTAGGFEFFVRNKLKVIESELESQQRGSRLNFQFCLAHLAGPQCPNHVERVSPESKQQPSLGRSELPQPSLQVEMEQILF